MENQALKNKIMRRVYMTWFLKKTAPIVFLQLPLIAGFLAIEHEYVAFKAVASNTFGSLGSPSSLYHYAVAAFQNAEPLVAFMAVAIGLFAVLAVTSIIRNIRGIYSKRPVAVPARLDK